MVFIAGVTFVITVLAMLVIFFHDKFRQKDSENRRLRAKNDGLTRQVSEYNTAYQNQLVQQAYDKGLYMGRETDTLYRGMLQRMSNGEQATVLLQSEAVNTMGG